MWPFKKKPVPRTLKTRVTEFWSWFEPRAQRFYETIEDGRCPDLHNEVSAAVDRLSPSMAWVFGAGENKAGHSLTLSGEAIVAKQFVAEYWRSRAPKLEHWTFYSARQPADDIRGFKLELRGVGAFQPEELWLCPWVDEQAENIDITAWHPLYAKLTDRHKFSSLFLLLDEILGEHGTQQRIGEIKFSDHQLKESIPAWELREYVQQTEKRLEWKTLPPTETYTGYQVKKPFAGMRGDIFVGSARCWALTREYLENKGPIDHPVPDAGVDFAYLAFPSAILPKGQEVDFRCGIEEDLAAALRADLSGETMGGATGSESTYIDFMTFDGEASIQQVRQVARQHQLPKETRIGYLTKDKAAGMLRI